jgi:1-aminocyclopropane-1-carboxylate deaminase
MEISHIIKLQPIVDDFLNRSGIEWWIARLDDIHPVVSGNKLYKLSGFMEEFHKSHYDCIITSGGAYSNHLSATAFYAKQKHIPCFGIVRGDEPQSGSHTLESCKKWDMKLIHVSSDFFKSLEHKSAISLIPSGYKKSMYIPSGGYDQLGTVGIAPIWKDILTVSPTHITCSIGTGTTIAGLFHSCPSNTQIIGIPALKGMNDFEIRWRHLCVNLPALKLEIWDHEHWGGYARKNQTLIDFMNDFYIKYSIPTDFVYTAKHFHAVIEKIKSGHFATGSKIVSLHTGGLQGNFSLDKNALCFNEYI